MVISQAADLGWGGVGWWDGGVDVWGCFYRERFMNVGWRVE